MKQPQRGKPGKPRYPMLASMIPGIQGVCFLFFMGIVRRTFDLHFMVDVIGFIGLIVGFLISSWRFWFVEPKERPPQS
jgi:hypothetical protein